MARDLFLGVRVPAAANTPRNLCCPDTVRRFSRAGLSDGDVSAPRKRQDAAKSVAVVMFRTTKRRFRSPVDYRHFVSVEANVAASTGRSRNPYKYTTHKPRRNKNQFVTLFEYHRFFY